ncbi:MAG: DUF3718 domain-containing protein [Glaciecola sp.]
MNISTAKNIALTSIISVSSLFAAANASASTQYIASDNSVESQLCVAAASMDKNQLSSKLDDMLPGHHSSKHYRLIANKLVCNGIFVDEFAAQAGNYAIAEKIANYRDQQVIIRDIATVNSGIVEIIAE